MASHCQSRSCADCLRLASERRRGMLFMLYHEATFCFAPSIICAAKVALCTFIHEDMIGGRSSVRPSSREDRGHHIFDGWRADLLPFLERLPDGRNNYRECEPCFGSARLLSRELALADDSAGHSRALTDSPDDAAPHNDRLMVHHLPEPGGRARHAAARSVPMQPGRGAGSRLQHRSVGGDRQPGGSKLRSPPSPRGAPARLRRRVARSAAGAFCHAHRRERAAAAGTTDTATASELAWRARRGHRLSGRSGSGPPSLLRSGEVGGPGTLAPSVLLNLHDSPGRPCQSGDVLAAPEPALCGWIGVTLLSLSLNACLGPLLLLYSNSCGRETLYR